MYRTCYHHHGSFICIIYSHTSRVSLLTLGHTGLQAFKASPAFTNVNQLYHYSRISHSLLRIIHLPHSKKPIFKSIQYDYSIIVLISFHVQQAWKAEDDLKTKESRDVLVHAFHCRIPNCEYGALCHDAKTKVKDMTEHVTKGCPKGGSPRALSQPLKEIYTLTYGDATIIDVLQPSVPRLCMCDSLFLCWGVLSPLPF